MPRFGEVLSLNHLANDPFAQTRIYAIAAIIKYLLDFINPSTSWAGRLRDHLDTFPVAPQISIGQAGFPENWAAQPLWTFVEDLRSRSR
jgi:abortive infection bacteriophage resistance protein